MPNSEFEQALLHYKNQHRSIGCILTHLFGVPILALSLPLMLLNFRRGLTLFAAGWALQLFGHFYFEKNKPIVMSSSRTYLVPFAALYMIMQYWRQILTGHFSVEEQNGHKRTTPDIDS